MSAEEFSDKEPDTQPHTPISIFQAKAGSPPINLAEALANTSLTDDQRTRIKCNCKQFEGPTPGSIDIGKFYAYLLREIGLEYREAIPIFRQVRERYKATLMPPRSDLSDQYEVEIPPQKPLFLSEGKEEPR